MASVITPPDRALKPRRTAWDRWSDRGFVGLTAIASLSIAVVLGALVILIAVRAWPAIRTEGLGFWVGRAWNPVAGREAFGVLPLLWGTVMSSAFALAIAIPLGLGTAIFLSEPLAPGWVRSLLGLLVELLAAIPSVVYGFWGLRVLVPLMLPWGQAIHAAWGWVPLFSTSPLGPGLLPAALVLAIMVVPMIAAISRDALLALPLDLRLAARSVGSTRWEAIAQVFIPAAATTLGGGILLALGRALGETMAIALLIGNVPQISPSLFAPASAIASTLANQFAAAKDLHIAALMYAALVLLLLTLAVNLAAMSLMARPSGGGQGARPWRQRPWQMVWCRPGVRRGCDRAMTGLYGLATLLTVLPLGAILLDVGRRGSRRLDLALFTQLPPAFGLSGGGIAHALLGSLVVVGLASLITIPLGILAGLYLAELSPHHPIAQGLRLGVNVLSGVPSILAGVFAYGLLVVNGVVGFSAIAGAVALAVLMLPWVVRTTDDALRQVPDELRWAAASVGASPRQSLTYILLPAALPGITTGILLAIARAAGETAPLLFTALNSDFFPKNLVEPVATLSVLIYNFAIAPFPAQQDLAWAAALVLIAAILLLNLIARWLTRKTTAGTP